jgi:hypothetical protein
LGGYRETVVVVFKVGHGGMMGMVWRWVGEWEKRGRWFCWVGMSTAVGNEGMLLGMGVVICGEAEVWLGA